MVLARITDTLCARAGSHILYFYSSLDAYIQNAASFIRAGLQLGQHVIFIDNPARFRRIQEHLLTSEDITETELQKLHYATDHWYYNLDHDFDLHNVFANFESILGSVNDDGCTMRTWGHVVWQEQPDIDSRLRTFESSCDLTVSGLGYTTVCAYDAHVVPAYIQTEMMRHHEYFMTDQSLTRSNLYKESLNHPVHFPTLFSHDHVDSHSALHQQKLDFLHVLAHEVRNPLTVIEANAVQLVEEEPDMTRRQQLETIRDHSKVIDYEIAYMIAVERMLTTDLMWQKKPVLLLPIVLEIANIIKLKAHTQNMNLVQEIQLDGNEAVFANKDGLQIILLNLLDNAIQFRKESQDILLSVKIALGNIVLQVTDYGIGMTEEQLQRLFYKHEDLVGESEGLGQGLYLVHQLVQHFEGRISVKSQLNAGCTVRIELPFWNHNLASGQYAGY